jgi:hypothetical protein
MIRGLVASAGWLSCANRSCLVLRFSPPATLA